MSIESWTTYEWGYRLADGTEEWAIDHGTDGAWTNYRESSGIEAIDIYDGEEAEAIYAALDKAGVEGVAIRRKVVHQRWLSQDVPRPAVGSQTEEP